MRILIVDDNPSIRRLIRKIVAGPADEIRECGDAKTALEAYQSLHPEFVLMDLEMDQVDGIAATRTIHEADPLARVVIVTNHDHPTLREAAAQAGACGYFVKEDLLPLKRMLDGFR